MNTGNLTTENSGEEVPAGRDLKLRLQTFVALLNREPNQAELTKTPDNKAQTLPISFVEMALDELFFGMWQTKNFNTKQVLNEFVGEIELSVKHPITGEWITRIGAASIVITQDADTKVSDFLQFKKKNALDLAYPKLKAESVKNAAISLGKFFGRDLNRKLADEYNPLIQAPKDEPHTVENIKSLVELKASKISDSDMDSIERIIGNNETDKFKFVFNKLKSL